MDDEEGGKWLHAERIECPHCHVALYRVDHSPFYDEDFFYCDRCPIHAEVRRYAPEYDQATRSLPQPQANAYVARMRAIEMLLKPCVCGGSFRFDAPRRCLACHAPVITEYAAGVDLYFWSEAIMVDLSDEEMEAEWRRHQPFRRTDDLWMDR